MDSRRNTLTRAGATVTPEVAEATAAVTAAWREAGWPRPPCRRLDYRHVQQALVQYLRVAFAGTFTAAERDSIVGTTLVAFMAPLHARVEQPANREPEELVRAVRDAALDRGQATVPRRPSDERDDWLTQIAFGASPDQVREGLRTLQRDDKSTAFLIVTQYLDLGDVTGEPPRAAEVAANLNRAASTEPLSEQHVRDVLSTFGRDVRAT